MSSSYSGQSGKFRHRDLFRRIGSVSLCRYLGEMVCQAILIFHQRVYPSSYSSYTLWGDWYWKRVKILSDNSAFVAYLRVGLCHDRHLAFLLLEFFCVCYSCRASHLQQFMFQARKIRLLMLFLDCNSDVRNFVSNAGEENLLMNPSGSILPASELTLLRFVSFKSTTCGADSIGV